MLSDVGEVIYPSAGGGLLKWRRECQFNQLWGGGEVNS